MVTTSLGTWVEASTTASCVDDYRDISSTIHQLNSHVYDSLVALKHHKLAGLTHSTTQEAVFSETATILPM